MSNFCYYVWGQHCYWTEASIIGNDFFLLFIRFYCPKLFYCPFCPIAVPASLERLNGWIRSPTQRLLQNSPTSKHMRPCSLLNATEKSNGFTARHLTCPTAYKWQWHDTRHCCIAKRWIERTPWHTLDNISRIGESTWHSGDRRKKRDFLIGEV